MAQEAVVAEGGKVVREQHCLWKLEMAVQVQVQVQETRYTASQTVEMWRYSCNFCIEHTTLYHLQNINSLALPTCSLLSLAMQPRKAVVGGPSS